ncbi:MAG: transcription termination factor Rho [Bacteroidaceae bacterium]|nr:transcription termination factor Rho [Bacteroidaceae bacterium]
MHTKSQLESMSVDELHALADQIGAEQSNDQITLIYNIIDKESEVGSMEVSAEAKSKKRGRKSKAEKQADAKEAEQSQESKEEKEESAQDNAGETPQPKKRGRKPKAEKAAAEANADAENKQDAPQQPEAKEEKEPEAKETKVAKKRGRKPKAETATQEEPATLPEQPEEQPAQTESEAQPDGGTQHNFRIKRDIRPTSLILAQIQAESQKEKEEAENEGEEATEPKAEEKTYSFGDLLTAEGVLEISSENNNGFLRSSDFNYMPSPDDVLITYQQIKNYGLKTGDVVRGTINMPSRGEKYYTLGKVISINGCDPRIIRDRSPFENLTPLFPDEKFNLCSGSNDPLSVRIVDLFSPIGKGQRALIVAQPKTGKTILMKEIANAIAKNHPEAYLMMLLVDERPEEVTDMARTVKAEVIASTFDEPAERHVRIAGIVLEKAKRMVECGHDVVIFLDSITRLARAYNTVTPASGKVLTGGVDANAMHKPKRFFGAARNIEGGGSLTIIATALTDTGSKMDEVIFEEFKGTGNMELQLDRMLANKRIFPAVNIVQSSTRRDDLLQDKMTLDRMWILRKFLADMNAIEAMTEVKQRIERTQNNEEFLISMNS